MTYGIYSQYYYVFLSLCGLIPFHLALLLQPSSSPFAPCNRSRLADKNSSHAWARARAGRPYLHGLQRSGWSPWIIWPGPSLCIHDLDQYSHVFTTLTTIYCILSPVNKNRGFPLTTFVLFHLSMERSVRQPDRSQVLGGHCGWAWHWPHWYLVWMIDFDCVILLPLFGCLFLRGAAGLEWIKINEVLCGDKLRFWYIYNIYNYIHILWESMERSLLWM